MQLSNLLGCFTKAVCSFLGLFHKGLMLLETANQNTNAIFFPFQGMPILYFTCNSMPCEVWHYKEHKRGAPTEMMSGLAVQLEHLTIVGKSWYNPRSFSLLRV